ncbi:MAG: helix-turn-helix transcriptional regulator [Mitsuokella sp.]
MSVFPFGIPHDTSFEPNRAPFLDSVENVTEDASSPSHSRSVPPGILELLFVECGTCRITSEATPLILKKGTLALLCGGRYPCRMANRFGALAIRFGGVHLRGLPSAKPAKTDAPITVALDALRDRTLVFSLLQGIKLLAIHPENPCRLEVGASLAQALIVLLAAHVRETRDNGADTLPFCMGIRIKEYIDAHYLEDLKLSAIADALHINPYYLSHTFKSVAGISPMAYIIRRRIDEAQNLLLTTDMTITAIAMECGYHNSNYFQSVFKGIVGMTPGRYRRTWKQDAP